MEEMVEFLAAVQMRLKAMMILRSFLVHSELLIPYVEDPEEGLDRPGKSYIPSST